MTLRCSSIPGRSLALILTVLLFHHSCWALQSPTGIRLQVVEGNNAVYTTEQVPETTITVRLIDRNGRPLPDVGVVFTSPESGPGGEFPNGLTTTTVITDNAGLAVTRLFHPNPYVGEYVIGARAEYNGEIATATLRQRNVAPDRGLTRKILIFAAVGAAAGAAIALGKGGEGPSTNPPSQNTGRPAISFGSAAVGAPQP